MNRRDAILAAVEAVPALPTAATEVLALVQDPAAGVADVMAVVEQDPAFTAELLRLANSAYFAGPREISSLRDAGVVLGLNRVLQLVLATAVFPLVRQPIQGYDLPAGELLRHSVSVAVGAETLARVLRLTAPSHNFTAALLHDVGKIVLGTHLEVDAGPIRDLALRERMAFDAAEREILGIDHAEAGAALLKAWGIPETVAEAVRWHHLPEAHVGDKTVVDLVHVADILSVECGVGLGIDGLAYVPNPGTIERLGIDQPMAEAAAFALFRDFGHLQGHLSAGP